jgi:hypothetical protein
MKEIYQFAISDRLFLDKPELHNELCQKHFGDISQNWDGREIDKIESFLMEYFDKNLSLISVSKDKDAYSGLLVWTFKYAV